MLHINFAIFLSSKTFSQPKYPGMRPVAATLTEKVKVLPRDEFWTLKQWGDNNKSKCYANQRCLEKKDTRMVWPCLPTRGMSTSGEYTNVDIRRVYKMRVEGSRGCVQLKQQWSDTIKADLYWLDVEQGNISDRVRWKSLVELGVRQKPATQSGYGGDRCEFNIFLNKQWICAPKC